MGSDYFFVICFNARKGFGEFVVVLCVSLFALRFGLNGTISTYICVKDLHDDVVAESIVN